MLKRLKEFNVVIEDLSSTAIEAGLTRETLQTDVELRLRKAGIRVRTKEDEQRHPTVLPFVYVQVGAIRPNALYVAYDVRGAVNARVTITMTGRRAGAEIWTTSAIGFTPQGPFVESARNAVADQVDKLINDWLSVSR